MPHERRESLWRDAGGDVEEESAVCFLQVLLADYLPGLGRNRVLEEMDEWGYTFREGSATIWFRGDGRIAHEWLLAKDIIDHRGKPTWQLRASL